MKRWTRRCLSIVLGLALGWWAAGLLPGSIHARETTGHHAVESAEPSHHDAAEPAHGGDHAPASGHVDGAHPPDAGQAAATALAPAESTSWYRPVLFAAAGLFVAALVLGLPALKLRGPEPADPADTHHDDHAHDHTQASSGHGH